MEGLQVSLNFFRRGMIVGVFGSERKDNSGYSLEKIVAFSFACAMIVQFSVLCLYEKIWSEDFIRDASE